MLVERLSEIEQIQAWEDEFAHSHGVQPFNISSWHVSDQFRNRLIQKIAFPEYGNAIDYIYSYSITKDIRDRVLEKLGVSSREDATVILMPNNTLSILNAANLLQKYGYKKICIVNPAYFSVSSVLTSLHLNYGVEYMARHGGHYHFPLDAILNGGYDAVWITSPIFSTGVYMGAENIEKIRRLLDKGMFLITDESFCLNGHELVRAYGVPDNLLAIYSPHKAISCNGYKFSGIVASAIHEDFLDQWIDVLCGNLPFSTCSAILHFLSENYSICQRTFLDEMKTTYAAISPFLVHGSIQYDSNPLGSLFTVYCHGIQDEPERADSFYSALFKNTYTSILPGRLNGFAPELGLCFRINLALDSVVFRQSVQRVIPYLGKL